ncbi:MAG: hypothetical protein VB858_11095 [Planctomycetaceae bacterium]|jgi:hypothetical protein
MKTEAAASLGPGKGEHTQASLSWPPEYVPSDRNEVILTLADSEPVQLQQV